VSFVIRPARAADVPLIVPWTQDTFSWGDYVAERLPAWLEEPDTLVLVCVLDDDLPVAMSRAELLSPVEAWLSAARVHPDHRRVGMGRAMNDYAVEWARDKGALVARLAVEVENEAAIGQVLRSGYRQTGEWVNAAAPPSTGRRLGNDLRLRPGTTVDADAAWTFWSQSDLAHAAHDLISVRWRWRKASVHDLDKAVDAHGFLQGAGGWAIIEPDDAGTFVRWLATTQADAPLLLQGLRDLQRDSPGEQVELMVPAVGWMLESLQREGFALSEVRIFAKSL
jgi:ribosomal protein S18 acetylase RimI-like enzyme